MADIGVLADHIDRPELARQLGCSEKTVARYEAGPDGLPSTMIAGRKYYRLASVQKWLEGRERSPNPRRGA